MLLIFSLCCCVLCALCLCVSREELFRVDGSGSGAGDMDFFFSPIHTHGKQLSQSPFLVFFLASHFKDNNTNHTLSSSETR